MASLRAAFRIVPGAEISIEVDALRQGRFPVVRGIAVVFDRHLRADPPRDWFSRIV